MSKYGINYLLWILLLLGGTLHTSLAKGNKLIPKGLHLGWNLTNPFYYQWVEKTGDQYNVQATLDFSRILLEGAYGWGTMKRKNPTDKPLAYTRNQGNYWSMGICYNFIHDSQENNLAFLGFRYSSARFTNRIIGKLQDESVVFWSDKLPLTSQSKEVFLRQKHTLKANWFELTAGVRAHVWWWLYAGTTVFYRFAKDITIFDVHMPFDIIGWGLNEEEDTWGIHYYVTIRIPFQANAKEKADL